MVTPAGEPPFRIEVLDRTFKLVAFVGAPISVTLTPRHNAVSTCEITLPNDAPAAAHLLQEGARLRVTYNGDVYTGPVRRVSGVGPTFAGQLTFGMDDDFRLLSRLLAWPIPTAALTAQTREFHTLKGPAETVAKTLISANAQRLGIPLTVEPDQARGTAIRVDARMQPPADVLLPKVDLAGIGLTVTQVGAGYRLAAYTPRVYPYTLTEESRVVVSWELSRDAPTATRVVVGGGLGDEERYNKEPQDFIAAVDGARETAWNDVVEVYVDAGDAASDYLDAIEAVVRARQDAKDRRKDVKDAEQDLRAEQVDQRAVSRTSPTTAETDAAAKAVADATTALNAAKAERDKAEATITATVTARANAKNAYRVELADRASEAVAEGAPRAGVRVTLSETEHFRYGGSKGLRRGDRVRIEVGPGVLVDEVLREATVSWAADAGLLVTPVVGEVVDSPVRSLVRGVSRIAANVRALRSNRRY